MQKLAFELTKFFFFFLLLQWIIGRTKLIDVGIEKINVEEAQADLVKHKKDVEQRLGEASQHAARAQKKWKHYPILMEEAVKKAGYC